jgi:hypothetical protein
MRAILHKLWPRPANVEVVDAISIRKVYPSGRMAVARVVPKGRPKPSPFGPKAELQERLPTESSAETRLILKGRPKPITLKQIDIQMRRLGARLQPKGLRQGMHDGVINDLKRERPKPIPKQEQRMGARIDETRLMLEGRPKPITLKQADMQKQRLEARLRPKRPRQSMHDDAINDLERGRPKPIPRHRVEVTMKSPRT